MLGTTCARGRLWLRIVFRWSFFCLVPAAHAFEFKILGNQLFPAEVYLSILDPPTAGPPTPEDVNESVAKVEAFLHQSGYALCDVSGQIDGESVMLTVNEGQLEKIVFRGRMTLPMVRFRLALDVPRDIFNQPSLERQILELSGDLGIEPPAWKLVETRQVQHLGPQVESLGPLATIKGQPILKARQRYELHVIFPDKEWSVGLGLDVRITYFDGFELGLNYQSKKLFFSDDHWRIAGMGGVGFRQAIGDNLFYVFPSRIYAECQWFTPRFTEKTRAFLWVHSEATARQRRDLNLENMFFIDSALSANIEVRPFSWLEVRSGFGLQNLNLFGERAPPNTEAIVSNDVARWRGFVSMAVEATFSSGDGRWDRRHRLLIEGRLFTNARVENVNFGDLQLRYQKVFAFGWHDLWIKARGSFLKGDVLYPFEEPVAENLRGLYPEIFVQKSFGARAEFRFSLTRDLLKLGLFVDTVAFGEIERVTGEQHPRFGLGAGPGFHALLEGFFQLDLYASFGVLSNGRVSTGLNAVLLKVF
jgi:hypothetical protein